MFYCNSGCLNSYRKNFSQITECSTLGLKVEKYYAAYWYDRDPNWMKSGRLINIRKINLEDSLATLVQSEYQTLSG